MSAGQGASPSLDPVAVLKGFVSLRRLAGSYPAGHPIDRAEARQSSTRRSPPGCATRPTFGSTSFTGRATSTESRSATTRRPIGRLSRSWPSSASTASTSARASRRTSCSPSPSCSGGSDPAEPANRSNAQLSARGVTSISLGRLVPLDTRWRAQQWPEAPTGPLDPDYAESLALAEQTFDRIVSSDSGSSRSRCATWCSC